MVSRWGFVAMVSLLFGGCLPEGGPGVGEHVVDARGVADVAFSREKPGGPGGHFLFTRPTQPLDDLDTLSSDARSRDLYVVPRSGGEAQRIATELVANARSSAFWDARGQLYVQRNVMTEPAGGPGRPGTTSWELVRLDLEAREEASLGRVRDARLSPERRLVFLNVVDGGGLLRDLDGGERALGAAVREPRFFGEDLAFQSGPALRWIEKSAAAPRTVLTNVLGYRRVPGATGGPALIAVRFVETPRDKNKEIVIVRPAADPVETRVVARARIAGDPFISPDGRRVAFAELGAEAGSLRLRVLDLADGREQSAEMPVPPLEARADGERWPPKDGERMNEGDPRIDVSFRPGSDEVWWFVNFKLRVLRAAAVVAVDRRLHTYARIGPNRAADPIFDPDAQRRQPRGSLFTADGRRWVFLGEDERLRLGDAGNPEAVEGVVVSSPGRWGNIVEIEPRRRLAVWFEPGNDRQDLYLFDFDNPVLRFVARDVGATAFGVRRVLAIARKLGDRRATGDLVIAELETGAETVLAQNVGEFAVEPVCGTCDPTGPDVPFAYSVQARIPYRYEGLWAGTLP